MQNHIDDLISAYIDNELAENERQQVEEHLHICSQCSSLLRDVMNIQNQIFSTFHSIDAPESLEKTVFQAINSQSPLKASPLRYWLLVPLVCSLLFTAFALALMGSFVFKIASVSFNVIVNLIYAMGSILASHSYVVISLIGFSLLLIIASSVSLKHLLKTKAIWGD